MAAIQSTIGVMLMHEQMRVPPMVLEPSAESNGFNNGVFHKTVAKPWQLQKQLQVGKSQSNKPPFQPFQHFSHALMTTIVSAIQFYIAWKAIIALKLTFQIANESLGV
jgi:hypothetical protein